jgi:homoserine kinase
VIALPPAPTIATATAPGGIGNMGPALDVLGCALAGVRDEVEVRWTDVPGISVAASGHPDLPTDPTRHASAIAADAALAAAREMGLAQPSPGLQLTLRKRLPLAGGQGGSAASAVAGAVATNALLGAPLDDHALLRCALVAEAKVAGRHLDNIAPSLVGGIVLVRSLDPIDVIRLPVPDGLHVVLAHPDQRLSTADARRVLPAEIPRDVAIHQMAQVAAMVAACFEGDLALLGRAIDDRIAEPARATLLPGFADAKRAALAAGALGASISGAGPTAFAFARGDAAAAVATAMASAYEKAGVSCRIRVTEIDRVGALAEVS